MTAPGARPGDTTPGKGFDASQSTALPSTGGTTGTGMGQSYGGSQGMGSEGMGGQDVPGSGMKNQLRDAKDQVVDTAKSTLFQARDSAASSLNDSKSTFADQLASVANAFRTTTDQLRGQNQHKLAEYSDGLAGQVDRFVGYLRNADFNAMRRDVEDTARRRPTAVVGGAFVLGLLGARFLKSSQRSQRHDDASEFGRTEYGPRGERLGRDTYGNRGYGQSAYGQSAYGESAGRSAYGQPGAGQTAYGAPSYGQSAIGEPGYGDVGGPTTGSPRSTGATGATGGTGNTSSTSSTGSTGSTGGGGRAGKAGRTSRGGMSPGGDDGGL